MMGMPLQELLEALPIGTLPPANPTIRGISQDSRTVEPGDLYVAIVGEHFDGRRFAADAAANGAVAVLGPPPASSQVELPWVESREPRLVLGPLASRLYGHPDRELLLAGITGTNGKSTVVALLAAILEAAGRPAGRLGTLGYVFGDQSYAGKHTTPEAPEFFRALRLMRDAGAAAAVMEVSSHALDMGRVNGASFAVAAFTNLSRDHLDFHGDMEAYFAAKRELFAMLGSSGRAVVHLGTDYGHRLASELGGQVLTCGAGGAVRIDQAELSLTGTRGVLHMPSGLLEFVSPLLGRFNLENLLTAAAAAEALGLPHSAIAEGLESCVPPPGRLERVANQRGLTALIDYAHTPAALEAALGSVRELAKGRISVVFGAGGERDIGKRPQMGQIAAKLADRVVLTSDNPRGEDPQAILADIRAGVEQVAGASWAEEPDRPIGDPPGNR
nr:UDP-N-acetylmuramoyl-L-alanyl-D-glutamate--2,6-diaminopimelate ligase-like [Nerophis lumbriciformis]